MRQKLTFTAVLIIFVAVLGVMSVREQQKRADIVFAESLDRAVATVDENTLTLRDVAFYIAYQEGKIEETARIYNPGNTGDYWRIHTNHTFVREKGKTLAMDMAVHDEIFYRLALTEEVELTGEEQKYLANSQYDFWSDLEEEQRAALGVSEEELAESMARIALAEKYQAFLAAANEVDFESYAVGGESYERLLKEHTYEVDASVWDRVDFGGITVDH